MQCRTPCEASLSLYYRYLFQSMLAEELRMLEILPPGTARYQLSAWRRGDGLVMKTNTDKAGERKSMAYRVADIS